MTSNSVRSRLCRLHVLPLVALAWPALAQTPPPSEETPVTAGPVRRSQALSPMGRQWIAPRVTPAFRAPAATGALRAPEQPEAEEAAHLPPAVCGPVPPAAPPSAPLHGSQAAPYRPFPATWQHTLDSFVTDGSIPGAVIIVKSPDWGLRVGVTGEANLLSHEKMAPDLQFRVGSVTKAFLAQAVLRLEQEGKIKLSDPVTKYLGDDKVVPGIPYIDTITVADLLQMTSGISNYLDASVIGDSPQVTPQRKFTPDELMSVLSGLPAQSGQPAKPPLVAPYFQPGSTYANPFWLTVLQQQPPAPPEPTSYPAWNYTNSNYILLGMIVQKVTGMPPQDYLRRYVFDVAGLGDTYFATDDTQLPEIHGYTKFGSIPYPTQVYETWCDVTKINPSYAWTAGAIVSTPWDLLKLEDAMFASDTLLNQGTKNKWFTFVSSDIHLGWQEMQYGVGGLMQPERSYGSARGHGGAFPGYKTLLYYFYDQKTSFVLASNTWDEEWEVTMLDEIMPQVSSAVTTPWPENGAKAFWQGDGPVRLAWQAGRVYGSSYEVYWGASQDAVDRASASSHYGVQELTVPGVAADVRVEPGTTYYWRVDTVAPGQPLPLVIGPTWSFTVK
jgi:D-alanyl-D-alanine carboxypeptidase